MLASARDPLSRIRYITLDPSAPRTVGEFRVQPEIPLPVELEEDADPERLVRSGLSWEAIISAMLKILAYDPHHRHAPYFRDFVLAVRPDIDGELTQAAVAKVRSRGFDVAIEAFRALEGLDPGNPRHPINLALAYEERARLAHLAEREAASDEDLELAFQSYRRALKAAPEAPDSHWYLASFHLRQQSFDRAHAELKAFLALATGDRARSEEASALVKEIEARNLMDGLFRSAYDFIRLGQEEKGIERIREFLSTNPNVWNGWFLLGWAHRRTRRYEEAREAFRRALDLGEENIDILNELAICSMELHELSAAREHLERALRLDTENVKVLSNLAVLSMREGKLRDARTYFRLVLDIDPEDPVAKATIARLEDSGSPADPNTAGS